MVGEVEKESKGCGSGVVDVDDETFFKVDGDRSAASPSRWSG